MSSRCSRPTRAVVYTDGASLGNPGPAGAGVVIVGPDERVIAEVGRSLGVTTGNCAEYSALLCALKECEERGIREVEVRSDSQLLCAQMNGQWRVRSPELRSLHEQAREVCYRFDAVVFRLIPRLENGRADRIARLAAARRL